MCSARDLARHKPIHYVSVDIPPLSLARLVALAGRTGERKLEGDGGAAPAANQQFAIY